MLSNFVKEFRDFAMKGNVVDLAVGVIIGAAFGKIVSSLVADVITPLLGIIVGGVDFSNLAITLKAPSAPGATDGVRLMYGKFFQTSFDFLIIAFSLFLVIKAINAVKKKEAAAPAEPTAQEKLLTEIRDLLARR